MGPYQRTPFSKLLELLDTQVFVVSIQWVRPLEISWTEPSIFSIFFLLVQSTPTFRFNNITKPLEAWKRVVLHTVDGNQKYGDHSPVEVGRFSHYSQGFSTTKKGGWEWDF